MDALDLLFRRVVLAAHAAGTLEQPLDLGDVLDRYAPYKLARRDGQMETNDDYLHAVMRLASGERDLVFSDDLFQDDLKAELATPNPDLAVLRTYLNTKLRLATAQVQRVLEGDTAIDLRPATPAAATPATARNSRQTEPRAAMATAEHLSPVGEPRVSAATGTVHPGCPYCAQPLPGGRSLKFCPSCGQNLLVRRCSGCSAEIESGWKFCVTCGRAAS